MFYTNNVTLMSTA